ncbi:MAG: IS1595 family transposase [Microscillaceae bacterium]|jgi:transposase-like protein|nr:IS1595 family transposase [Microscillaceae bacterium]
MNILEIDKKFPDKKSCIDYLEKLKWGKKPKCPYCNSDKLGKQTADFRHYCKSCRRSFSVLINTQLQGTKMPLKLWFYAIGIITDAKKGVSALQLQRNLGAHYESVFYLYHKIRDIMEDENADIPDLEGVLEMDETFVGGKPRKKTPTKGKFLRRAERDKYDDQKAELEKKGFEFREGTYKKKAKTDSKRGRGTDKIAIAGIVARDGNVVAQVMSKLTYKELKDLVQKSVNAKKSVLLTDDFKGYNKMNEIIDHIKLDHKTFYSYKGLDNNTIESFWAIIKRGIMGQYHQVTPKYLPNYVAEFVYKYNHREDTSVMFDKILKKLVEPIEVTPKKKGGKNGSKNR